MTIYAQLCGWPLARAHTGTGDRVALAAYLGGSAKFAQAIAEFADAYADQNERDYAAVQDAAKGGIGEAPPRSSRHMPGFGGAAASSRVDNQRRRGGSDDDRVLVEALSYD
ncbi:DUF2252 family protein [Amycolatopsis carbonis]|uniref:DUF2252 family protein n=1 Tax=Amycolatopsis carbonis TaxID=715471 RepID=A0A9Y2I926_9PSEU|nr:DUF2252 family protein [Amycolatopsis sp. 2-15]WIX75554.1 DUF2252 family protein [Amycolatopsis sp. 2-15]